MTAHPAPWAFEQRIPLRQWTDLDVRVHRRREPPIPRQVWIELHFRPTATSTTLSLHLDEAQALEAALHQAIAHVRGEVEPTKEPALDGTLSR